MNVSLPQAGIQSPTRIAKPQMYTQTAGASDASPTTSGSDFDLSVLNHSREMYFLPGMDRLAATLAAKAETPVKVRMEARGQFLEYVIDGKHPEAVIEASLNGSPFKMIPKHNDDGSWDMNADTTGGTVAGTITQEPQGTHFGGLITAPRRRGPILHRAYRPGSARRRRCRHRLGQFRLLANDGELYQGQRRPQHRGRHGRLQDFRQARSRPQRDPGQRDRSGRYPLPPDFHAHVERS